MDAVIPLLALNGPTASGKSRLAIEVASALIDAGQPAEVVNADSMLVYRGMDIGTAKPTAAERRGISHHLVDILDVTQTATVADFQRRARVAFDDIRGRGVVPIVVGGSALYMRAILDHFEFPGTDPDVRARWEAELERLGAPALHEVLTERSPAAALEVEPGNGRRIVRALEVLDLTGEHRPHLPEWSFAVPGVLTHGLSLERQVMDERIKRRVDQMWDAGLIEEVRGLVVLGLREGRTASKALGYRQILQYLDGELSEEQAREETVRRTRRFARKQLSWFRRDHRITWHEGTTPGLAAELTATVLTRSRQDVGE